MEKKIRYPVLEKASERYTKHTKKTTQIRRLEAFPELTISCMTPDMNRCLRQSPSIWENNTTIRTRFWFGCYPAYGFHVAEKRRVSPPQYLLYLINHHWFCLSVEPPLLYPEKLLQSCRAVQSPFVLLFILRMYNKRSNICLQALHKCNDAGYLCVTAGFNLLYMERRDVSKRFGLFLYIARYVLPRSRPHLLVTQEPSTSIFSYIHSRFTPPTLTV